jgi:hypothetical protein
VAGLSSLDRGTTRSPAAATIKDMTREAPPRHLESEATAEWCPSRPEEQDWLEQTGLRRAYRLLLENGFCCGADDAPDDLNRRWQAEIARRAQRDGLSVHFERVFSGPPPSLGSDRGEWILLARLMLPDGGLPPDPSAFNPGSRAETRRQLSEQWGRVLAKARRRNRLLRGGRLSPASLGQLRHWFV